jgi:hypothetical protein
MSAPTTDRAAISQIIDALTGAGWVLDTVYDGEDNDPVLNKSEALALIMDLDEAVLHVKKRLGREVEQGALIHGWVRFVLGNEPFEVAADYTVNLEDALGPLFDRWEDQ